MTIPELRAMCDEAIAQHGLKAMVTIRVEDRRVWTNSRRLALGGAKGGPRCVVYSTYAGGAVVGASAVKVLKWLARNEGGGSDGRRQGDQ